MPRWSILSLLLLATLAAGCRHRRVIVRRSSAVVPRAMAPALAPTRRADCVFGYELTGGATLCQELDSMSLRRGADVRKLTRRRVLDATSERLAFVGGCEDARPDAFCVVTRTGVRTVALPAEIEAKKRWDVVLVDDETSIVGDAKRVLVLRGEKVTVREDLEGALKRDRNELCGPAPTGAAGCLGKHRVGRSVHRLADGTLALTVQYPTPQRTLARRLTLALAADSKRIRWTNTSPNLALEDSDELTCELGFTEWCRPAVLALTRKSRERALRIVEGACANDHRESCLEAGYALDRGASGDRPFAFAYLDRACTAPARPGKKDDAEVKAEACAVLATYLGDESAHHLDRERARGLVEPGCDGGDKQACARVAALLLDGAYATPDDKRAITLLEEACAEPKVDNTFACYRLALAHAEGRGVAKDPARADSLLRKACSEEDYVEPLACAALARSTDGEPPKHAAVLACEHWFAQTCSAP